MVCNSVTLCRSIYCGAVRPWPLSSQRAGAVIRVTSLVFFRCPDYVDLAINTWRRVWPRVAVSMLASSWLIDYDARWCSVYTGWHKKRGHRPSYLSANIPKSPWPNCMEIGGLLQYYMLNTVINFLFKNLIALWRHLAKTPLLSFIHTERSHSSCVFARWRHSAMEFLNKKSNDCVQHIILQKFTNFHAILSWSFQNICNEIGWPRFLRHPVRSVNQQLQFTWELSVQKTSIIASCYSKHVFILIFM